MAAMKKRLGTGKYLQIKHHKHIAKSREKQTEEIPQGFQTTGRPHKQTRQPHQYTSRIPAGRTAQQANAATTPTKRPSKREAQ
jgi:hypothetical protein